MSEGTFGDLTSTLPPWTCPAWLSFATGKNPGKLGVYGWDYIDPPDPTSLFDWSVFKFNPIWEIIGRAGMKSAVIGLPLTYPPKPVDGVLVSGFPAPAGKKDYTYPPELLHEIEPLVGQGYGPEPGVTNPEFMRGGVSGFMRTLEAHTQKTAAITRHILKHHSVDLAISVFVATDRVQHNLWHMMDESHPRFEQKWLGRANPVLTVYRQIDRAVSSVLEAVETDTNVIIMSDHGFGAFHGMFYINAWLMQQGFLALKPGLTVGHKAGFIDRLLNSDAPIFSGARKAAAGIGLFELAKRIRGKDSGLVSPELESFSRLYGLIDWPKTKAIGLEGDRIYLNRRGMSTGEYGKTRDDIIAGLKRITDPASGEPVVNAIHTCDEIHGENPLGRAPDILFAMSDYTYQQKLGLSPELWQIPFRLSGGHRLEGLLMMKGPQVKSRARLNGRIIDVAPTILHMLDVPIPVTVDGVVLKGAFREDSDLYGRDVRHQGSDTREALRGKIRGLRQTGKLSVQERMTDG